jgi:DNA-nicking Smr family endonuclease
MNSKYLLSDEDKAAFKDAMNGISPWDDAPEDCTSQDQRHENTKNEYVSLDYLAESEWVSGECQIQFSRSGVSAKQLKKLATGESRIDQKLDLHGYQIEKLHHKLSYSIHQARLEGARIILIIHGKGQPDKKRPAPLKNYINQSLRQNPDVLAFHSAKPAHGGAGAVYVLLRGNHV